MKLFIKPQLTTKLLAEKVNNKILFGSLLHLFVAFILLSSLNTAINYVCISITVTLNLLIMGYCVFQIEKYRKLKAKMIEEEMEQKEKTHIYSNDTLVEIEHELSLNALFNKS